MILLGHLHTHEFAVGGTTDQVGNPWALERSAGGSSGGSAAALAARMVPAATGTDTAGSLRIPSALSGTSTIKPTRGLSRCAASSRSRPASTTPGRWRAAWRTAPCCWRAWPGPTGRPERAVGDSPARAARCGARPLAGLRLALSPRTAAAALDADVAEGFAGALAACRALGAEHRRAAPAARLAGVGEDFLEVLYAELLVFHRRFDGRRDALPPVAARVGRRGRGARRPAERYVDAQRQRRETTAGFARWLRDERISALVEPTVPCVAPLRGDGYERAGSDYELISLTHYWDWTGFPVVALPAGIGSRSGLPVSVSLIGPAGADWELLDAGIQLQAELGVPDPYARA